MDEKTKKIVWLIVKIVLVIGVAVFIGVAFSSATAAIMAGVASGIGSFTSLGSDTRRMERSVNSVGSEIDKSRELAARARDVNKSIKTGLNQAIENNRRAREELELSKRTLDNFIKRNRDRGDDQNNG
jgi:hypothetical protein